MLFSFLLDFLSILHPFFASSDAEKKNMMPTKGGEKLRTERVPGTVLVQCEYSTLVLVTGMPGTLYIVLHYGRGTDLWPRTSQRAVCCSLLVPVHTSSSTVPGTVDYLETPVGGRMMEKEIRIENEHDQSVSLLALERADDDSLQIETLWLKY